MDRQTNYRVDTLYNMERNLREWIVLDGDNQWVADCRNEFYARTLVDALNEHDKLFAEAAAKSIEKHGEAYKKLAEM